MIYDRDQKRVTYRAAHVSLSLLSFLTPSPPLLIVVIVSCCLL